MRYDKIECSRSMLYDEAGKLASKDAVMPGPSIVMQSMRPVVSPDVPGHYKGCPGGGEGVGTVPVVPDRGMPGRGDDDNIIIKTKPNRVKGGLMAKVHFWEMKSDQLINENQGENTAAAYTDGDLGLETSNRDRKQRKISSNVT